MDNQFLPEGMDINALLKLFSGEVHLLEHGVPPDVQQAYFEASGLYHNLIGSELLPFELNIDEAILQLQNPEISMAVCKILLIQLGNSSEIAAFRAIETFFNQQPQGYLKDWSYLALQESRIHVENALSDDDSFNAFGIISTGLGSKNNKLRYVFAVPTLSGNALTNEQMAQIKYFLQQICDEHKSEVEELFFGSNYVKIVCLVPIEVALATIIEGAMELWKSNGNQFMYDGYFAINTHFPTEKELFRYFNKCWNPRKKVLKKKGNSKPSSISKTDDADTLADELTKLINLNDSGNYTQNDDDDDYDDNEAGEDDEDDDDENADD
ncbi:MAG: hypothetical protein IPI59_03240 [Sphingobacteriales bacterium]|nr:hypothetical protein [Sphingobacteriales bacterium]MBP9140557.1 hypothetical protein [Chitinophagales bacterium]MDA0197263.1 hypothetical protein [Bacteroidota bacterium]MBK7526573.1 hypothetical protein [Sphingobacteriales bacterium]MBL0248356.1 hypothetical protein [Sphingobacteriales bacterium]